MPFSLAREQRFLDRWRSRLDSKGHIPEDIVSLVDATYTLQIESREKASVSAPAPEHLAPQSSRSLGAPLLSREHFPHDREQARQLFSRLLEILEASPLEKAARLVRQALDSGDLDIDKAFTAYLSQDEDFFLGFARLTPESPRLLNYLAQAAITPGIAAGAELLAEHHAEDTSWPHQHCPLCGGLPLIGELRGKEGRKFVACSFCGFRYRIPRLSCAFCDERDTDKLLYFTVDGEPGYRVEVCDTCGHYLKVSDFRGLDRNHIPLLDDLESLTLDILAREKGYSRPTYSGMGF